MVSLQEGVISLERTPRVCDRADRADRALQMTTLWRNGAQKGDGLTNFHKVLVDGWRMLRAGQLGENRGRS